MPKLRLILLIAVVGVVVFALPAIADACPSCKVGISDGGNNGRVDGFFWSILYMMATPFVLLGTLVILFRRAMKASPQPAALPDGGSAPSPDVPSYAPPRTD